MDKNPIVCSGFAADSLRIFGPLKKSSRESLLEKYAQKVHFKNLWVLPFNSRISHVYGTTASTAPLRQEQKGGLWSITEMAQIATKEATPVWIKAIQDSSRTSTRSP